ncbi:MAG: hypothetical protein KF905_02025 [Flavobacteriales bacterium]|nr:hypothetical protein [Flavobacteriales bacterium]
MLKLSEPWVRHLLTQPETGMGYQIAIVNLKDGRVFQHVIIIGDEVHEVDCSPHVPFTNADILDIEVRNGLE